MVNLDIADKEIRAIVSKLKMDGLPSIISFDDVLPTLTEEQKGILSQLVGLIEKEKKVSEGKEKPKKGDDWYRVRGEMRKVMQSAIKVDLTKIGIIQRHIVDYGAVPDPQEQWKYYRLPDGSYACWNCGAGIMAKNVAFSVHFAEIPLAGGGEVRHKQVPYCPKYEEEPPDRGIITETIADSLQRDLPFLARKK